MGETTEPHPGLNKSPSHIPSKQPCEMVQVICLDVHLPSDGQGIVLEPQSMPGHFPSPSYLPSTDSGLKLSEDTIRLVQRIEEDDRAFFGRVLSNPTTGAGPAASALPTDST